MLTKVNSGKLLGIFGLAGAAMLFLSMVTTGQAAIWSLVLCGFFNSIMFPNIFALGIAGLGPMTSKGSGLIMTAVVGGAIVPYLLGKLIDCWANSATRQTFSTRSFCPFSAISSSPTMGCGDPNLRGL